MSQDTQNTQSNTDNRVFDLLSAIAQLDADTSVQCFKFLAGFVGGLRVCPGVSPEHEKGAWETAIGTAIASGDLSTLEADVMALCR